jgi:hypothetical protein
MDNNNNNNATSLHCAVVDACNNYSVLNVPGEGAFLDVADGVSS